MGRKEVRNHRNYFAGVLGKILETAASTLSNITDYALKRKAQKAAQKEKAKASKKKSGSPSMLAGTRKSSYKSRELKSLRSGVDKGEGKSSVQGFSAEFSNKVLDEKYSQTALYYHRIVARTPLDEDYQISTKKSNEMKRSAKGFTLKKYKDGHTEMRTALSRGPQVKWHKKDDEVAREKWKITLVNTDGSSLSLMPTDFGMDCFESMSGYSQVCDILKERNQERDFSDVKIENDSSYIDVLEFGRYSKSNDALEDETAKKGAKHFHGTTGGYSVQAPRGMVRLTDAEFETARVEAKKASGGKNKMTVQDVLAVGNLGKCKFIPSGASPIVAQEINRQFPKGIFKEEDILKSLLEGKPTVQADAEKIKALKNNVAEVAARKASEKSERRSRSGELATLKKAIIKRARAEAVAAHKDAINAIKELVKQKDYDAATTLINSMLQANPRDVSAKSLLSKMNKTRNAAEEKKNAKKQALNCTVKTGKQMLKNTLVQVVDENLKDGDTHGNAKIDGSYYSRIEMLVGDEPHYIIIKVTGNQVYAAESATEENKMGDIVPKSIASLARDKKFANEFVPIEKFFEDDVEDWGEDSPFSEESLKGHKGKTLLEKQFNAVVQELLYSAGY